MKKTWLLGIIFTALILSGCSEEEPLSPEDPLGTYLEHWEQGDYPEMLQLLEDNSRELIDRQEWEFSQRYEKVYSDLEIEERTFSYEAVEFDGEEMDLEELEEVTYEVQVRMASMAGEIEYTTEVPLIKNMEIAEQEATGEDRENPWEVVWEPAHLLKGMEAPEDLIGVSMDPPERGEIFDREGRGLAVNGRVYQASIVPEATEDLEGTVDAFASVLGLSRDRVDSLAKQYPDRPDWAAPVQRVSMEDPRVSELVEISGVLLSEIDGREYGGGEYTGHVIGHVGPITAEELEDREGEGYSSTSTIGKNGLELAYEEVLRGSPGVRITVTDEDGENERIIAETEAKNGEDIHLTIDLDLQQTLAETLEGEKGAVVLMDPKTGEVLALSSEPAFDSNLRTLGLPDPRASEMEDAGELFSRRFQNRYAPGSIFKAFTAVMGLEEGTLDPEESFEIEGLQWQESSQWGGYRVTRVTDRITDVNLHRGMVHSDNIYFAKQALALGGDAMERYGELLGFGREVPFEFPMYISSLSNEGINSEPLLADTGFGQGQIQVSPVHMTAMFTIFLNDGDMLTPRLFLQDVAQELEPEGEAGEDSEEDSAGDSPDDSEEAGDEEEAGDPSEDSGEFSPRVFQENIGSPENIGIVRDALIAVMEEESGSVYRENPGHSRKLAGKTGTAELKSDYMAEGDELLGWFVSFDYEAEDLLLTIMVENTEGRGGSRVALELSHEFWEALE
ncbi:penicillin-binding transpeptidase domain-containing protein [Isachenkonia alkalipeptolytica]|uniref:Uncharacterized protein n=1 Tax=Isachenkonia alkalipeptolytica TaxID=2565777 RepID=A0AA43XLZ7_9CLOT|nr:penicillin-binding transpeptidase domain-containing protein [Isachenkonia alkalipeptolytica]NBG88385.1 hypothetical protein [Isachenkonia alkalipeptolytica]